MKTKFQLKKVKESFLIDDFSFENYFLYEKYEDGLFWASSPRQGGLGLQDPRVFFILEIAGGIYYYAPPEDLLSYYAKLKSLLRSVPIESDCMFQSLFVSYRTVDFVAPEPKTASSVVKRAYDSVREKIERARREGYFDHYSKLREVKNFLVVSFPIKSETLSGKIEDFLDQRSKRLGKDLIATFKVWKKSVITTLQTLGVQFREVGPEDFLFMMFTIWNQDFDPIKVPYFSDVELRNQILYNLVTTDHHEISFSKNRWAVAYLEDLKSVAPGFLTDLMTLRRPFLVSLSLKRVSETKLKAALIYKKKSTFNRELIAKIEQVLDEVERRPVYEAQCVVGVLVDEFKDVELAKAELSDFTSEYGWKLYFEDLIAPDMFLSAMPAHQNSKAQRTVFLYEDHALCFLNFRNFRQKFSDDGFILVGEDLKPRTVNVFDSLAYGTMITGASGSGKTFFSQYAILMALAQGEKVIAIDPLGNLEPLTMLLGGKYYRIGLDSDSDGISIFPKISLLELKQNRDLVAQILETVTRLVLLGSEVKKLSASERALLQQALFYMYENSPEPSFRTFYDVLDAMWKDTKEPAIKEFAAALSLFLPDGAYGGLISEEPLDMSNPLTVFDLGGVKDHDDLTEIAIYGLVSRISEEILKRPGRKHVFIDEAHYLIRSKESVDFLKSGVRVWRTFNGALYIITQQLTDLLENPQVGEGIFKTVNNFFIFRQSAASLIQAQPYVGYNSAELDALKELHTRPGQYAFFGYFSRAMRDGLPAFGRFYLSLPKFLYWTLTTDAREKEKRSLLIKELEAQGLSREEAIVKAIEQLSGEKLSF